MGLMMACVKVEPGVVIGEARRDSRGECGTCVTPKPNPTRSISHCAASDEQGTITGGGRIGELNSFLF